MSIPFPRTSLVGDASSLLRLIPYYGKSLVEIIPSISEDQKPEIPPNTNTGVAAIMQAGWKNSRSLFDDLCFKPMAVLSCGTLLNCNKTFKELFALESNKLGINFKTLFMPLDEVYINSPPSQRGRILLYQHIHGPP